MDTGKRIFVKAIIWQIMGFVVMVAVGFVLTGSIETGGMMALLNTGIGFVTYTLYERVWRRIDWGRITHE